MRQSEQIVTNRVPIVVIDVTLKSGISEQLIIYEEDLVIPDIQEVDASMIPNDSIENLGVDYRTNSSRVQFILQIPENAQRLESIVNEFCEFHGNLFLIFDMFGNYIASFVNN